MISLREPFGDTIRDVPSDPKQGDGAPSSPVPRSEALTKFERSGSFALGFAGLVSGGWGVFHSDNQAGTTTILLVGAVFALMAIQGTAVRKFSKEGAEYAEREKKIVEEVTTKAQGALQADQPEAAAAYLDVIQGVLGSGSRYPASSVSALTHLLNRFKYERAVVDAIREELAESMPNLSISVPPDTGRAGFNAIVVDTQSPLHMVSIEILEPEPDDSQHRAYQLQRLIYRAKHRKTPMLLVASVGIKQDLIESFGEPGPFRFVHWAAGGDRAPLRDALTALIAAEPMKRPEPGPVTFGPD